MNLRDRINQALSGDDDINLDEWAALLREASDELLSAETDAKLWRKHKDTFERVDAIIQAARPLVNTMLRVEDAVQDAK